MNFKYLVMTLVLLNILGTVKTSKILGIFWTPSRSHHILASTLLQALAERGHNVTSLSSYTDDVNITTFRQKKLEGIIGTFNPILNPNISLIQQTMLIFPIMKRNAEKFWENKAIQELIKSKEKYDVIILMSFFDDGPLAISHHLGAPTIVFSPLGATSLVNKYVANPNLPYTTSIQTSKAIPNTFFGRLLFATMNILLSITEKIFQNPNNEKNFRAYLPNSPAISILQKNVSLVLVNSHHSIEAPRPYVPNIVQIGGFYAQRVKELPKVLKEYLDSAEDGAILFSFGTNMKIANIDKDKLDAILKGLGKVAPMKVLFKSETELENVPSNILVRTWLPQNDILAHPYIKAFISHGGLGGVTEAIFHGVPMLGIPLFADQKTNVLNAKNSGYAVPLDYEDITQETFDESLRELLKNTSYAKVAKKRSSLLRNQPIKPLDNAIWWVEHIIEHKGGDHLRNVGMDLEWYQLYMVDIMLFYVTIFMVIMFIIFICTRYVLRKIMCKIMGGTKEKYKKI